MSRYWTLGDIDWGRFRPDLVDDDMLATVKAAALVEANAPDYVTYLRNVFRDDADLCELLGAWGAEEEQHGAALARWATMADPSFDFEASLTVFRADYEQVPLDTDQSVRGSKLGELFARCVVESGTRPVFLSESSTLTATIRFFQFHGQDLDANFSFRIRYKVISNATAITR